MRNKKFTLFSYCFVMVIAFKANAQSDTLTLNLQNLEKRFLDSNLILLAAHYNVDANKALIEQAKLWDNPVLSTDQNFYANGKFFQHKKDPNTGLPLGQWYVQVQQLIKTAGKRTKLVNIANTTVALSELQLNDVLRNLRFQLRQNYYTLQHLLGNKEIAENELAQINYLLNAQEQQLKAGNIAEKDYLRIQAISISLQQDLTELNNNILDTENELKKLLQLKGNEFIVPAEESPDFQYNIVTRNELIDKAKKNNPNYLLQLFQINYYQQNLAYQKALKYPDVTVGTEYDHSGGYVPHFVGLTVSLPLPLFNKNQGNIKSAAMAVKQQQAVAQNAETELINNIITAYNKLQVNLSNNNNNQQQFYSKYKNMFGNMLKSYQQKQINLLEFLDFFDAYKEAQLKLLQQQLNIQLAKEEVNFEAGIDILHN